MSAPHLHAVPDPEPEEEPPLDDVPDVDDQDEDDAAGERPGRALVMPDLRPYYDLRALAELGTLAVDIGPALARGLGRVLRVLGRGVAVLAALGGAWLSGATGKGGSVGARLAWAAFAVYAVARLWMQHPGAAPYAAGPGLLLAVVLAGTGRLSSPGAKAKETEKKAEPRKPAPGQEKEEKRGGFLARLRKPGRKDEESTAGDVDEAPPEDPVTALLREQIGDENGVHLADLRPVMRERLPGLSTATNEELRQALTAAGYDPSRKFRARGAAGRAGVHRSQLPPLCSPGAGPGDSPRGSPAPGDQLSPADSSLAESGGEPDEECAEKGYSIVRDPERGPSAWKIRHYRR